jgi:DNA-binding NarL/FixJ family response regulator
MRTTSEIHPLQVSVLCRDAIVAYGLHATLNAHFRIDIQQHANHAELPRQTDVVICDFETGVCLAQGGSKRHAASSQAPKILIFDSYVSEHGMRRALSLGVLGCVLSSSPLDELVQAVRALANGKRFLTAEMAQRIADSIAYAPLTPRESDVLEWLGAGLCNKVIARNLGISVTTVKAHVKAIMEKLKADSRTQAVSVAAQRGLVGQGVQAFA